MDAWACLFYDEREAWRFLLEQEFGMQEPIVAWIIDFYLADEEGKPIGEKIDTQEVYRAKAPTRWADNHVFRLRRQLLGAEITYSIERIS